MNNKSKLFVICHDIITCEKKTVEVMAYSKTEAKEIVLNNHRTYEVNSVLSEDENKEIKSLRK